MPLPCPQVLISLINLHSKARENENISSTSKLVVSYLASAADKLTATLTGTDTTSNILQGIKEKLTAKIETAATLDDFINLIFILEQSSKEAQNVKQAKWKQQGSILCKILHANIRYIIDTLESVDDEDKKAFTAYKTQLKTDETECKKAMSKAHGHEFDRLQKKYHDLLIQNALLGDVDSLTDCRDRDLFSYMPKQETDQKEKRLEPGELHPAPYCLQSDFDKKLYKNMLQDLTKVDYDRFKSDAQQEWNTNLIKKKSDHVWRAYEEAKRRELQQQDKITKEIHTVKSLKEQELKRLEEIDEERRKTAKLAEEKAREEAEAKKLEQLRLAKLNGSNPSSSSSSSSAAQLPPAITNALPRTDEPAANTTLNQSTASTATVDEESEKSSLKGSSATLFSPASQPNAKQAVNAGSKKQQKQQKLAPGK